MPDTQVTPEPYPSTILSLKPEEQFKYGAFQVEAITVTPPERYLEMPGYVLSGPDPDGELQLSKRLTEYDVARTLPSALRAPVQAALSENHRTYGFVSNQENDWRLTPLAHRTTGPTHSRTARKLHG